MQHSVSRSDSLIPRPSVWFMLRVWERDCRLIIHMYVLLADELLKMSIEQQAYMLSSPEYFTSRVRDMEQVLRRYRYIAFIMHACMHCVYIYM